MSDPTPGTSGPDGTVPAHRRNWPVPTPPQDGEGAQEPKIPTAHQRNWPVPTPPQDGATTKASASADGDEPDDPAAGQRNWPVPTPPKDGGDS